MIHIIDSTLREGCQSAAGPFTIPQSMKVASLLCKLGIDMIECGHPSVDAEEMQRVRSVVQVAGDVPVLSHARATASDVEKVAASGAKWVGVFLGCNHLTRRVRVPGRTLRQLRRMSAESVRVARLLDLRVRYTVEDASRTDPADLWQQFEVAIDAGADRLCIADTVGCLEPARTRELVGEFAQRCPRMPLEVHLHDDRGLAIANALAAVDEGASWVSTSVNGLGERTGITDLAAFLLNLHLRGDRPVTQGTLLQELSSRVGAYSGARPDDRRPVVGRNAFRHVSRLHRLAVMRDPSSYELIDPLVLGRSRELGVLEIHKHGGEEILLGVTDAE